VKAIRVADLFCGAGGTSTGVKLAAAAADVRVELTAVNHWPVAVETHAANHPEARHLCESLDSVDPRKAVGGRLDLLWASPECTHHSRARGGKPINDQSRATAWCVVRWADAMRPRWIGVENVQEFAEWAPIGENGKPLKSRRGDVFAAWVQALRALGYTVDWRVLCAADYGAATTRTRLFVLARHDGGKRGCGPIPWPDETHASASAHPSLLRQVQPWRAAREIIDWSIVGRSIFGREKPLAENTLRRIAAGARKFWGVELEPFLIAMEHGGRVVDINKPLPTITCARGGAFGLVQPFMIGQQSNAAPRTVDQPMPTIAAAGKVAIVEPFLIGQQSGATPRAVSEPAPTLSTAGAVSLIEPFLVSFYGSGVNVSSIREPLRTLTTRDRHGLVTPAALDITFRMLKVHEGAAAMGFPASYRFAGTVRDQMAQVGNAVEVNQARALAAVMVADLVGRQERAA
jgi:DNA (cytosine-5)-methyltransferase 1